MICYETFPFQNSENVQVTQTTMNVLHLLTLNIHIIIEKLHSYIRGSIEGNKLPQIFERNLTHYKL